MARALYSWVGVGLSLFALTVPGCSTVVPIERRFPSPIVEPLPVEVGVHYDRAFRSYRYRREGDRWIIPIGPRSVALFDRVFGAMFEQAVPVKNDPTSPAGFTGLDAVIEPTIETYQFLSPAALDSKFYEASIEYRISLYTPNGELITDWPVTGHGRSYSRFWGAGQSLGEATTIAMRDAAAAMIINFKHRPSVRKWLLRINESQDRGSVTNARRISTTG